MSEDKPVPHAASIESSCSDEGAGWSRAAPLTRCSLQGISLVRCREMARQRHAAGRYDASTLACYRQALRLGKSATDLVAYLSFRRDMGVALHVRHAPYVRRAMSVLGPRAWLEAFGLLAEITDQVPPLPFYFRPFIARLRAFSPPLAAGCASTADAFGRGMSTLVQEQDAQRADFIRFLAEQTNLCVVGNAGQLNGSGLGTRIDAHDCVIRFNQYASLHSDPKDRGIKTDVWVRAPGFVPQQLDYTGKWGVVTGPDLRYRLTDWRLFLPLLDRGVPMLTVPLPIWRSLVQALFAPPSAGLLFLAWLRTLRPSGLQGVSLVGFQRGSVLSGGAYHHAVPKQPPGHRHNWRHERALLSEWMSRDKGDWLN